MLSGNQWYEQNFFLYIKKLIMYDLNRAVEGLFIDFLSRLSRRPLRKRREGFFYVLSLICQLILKGYINASGVRG